MAALISPPWVADEDDCLIRLAAFTDKLVYYDVADIAAVLDYWVDTKPHWPTWSDLARPLNERAQVRREQIEPPKQPPSSAMASTVLRTPFGQRALGEGWAESYLTDIRNGRIGTAGYGEDYAARKRRALAERRELTEVLMTDPEMIRSVGGPGRAQSLINLSTAMDKRNQQLAERFGQ